MRRALLVLLAVAVILGGVIYYFYFRAGQPLSLAPGHSPTLLEQLPKDAPIVAFADLAALRASSFSTELLALAPAPEQDPEYKAFVTQTGFDYTRDLDRAAIAIWPAATHLSTVAIAEGRFDREKISQYALRSGTLTQRGVLEIYQVRESFPSPDSAKPTEKTIELAFFSANRIALADGVALDAALSPGAASSSGATNADAPSLRKRIERVAGADFFATASLAAIPKDALPVQLRSGQLGRVLESVRYLNLAGQPQGERLSVVVDAECDSLTSALQLSTLLEGLRWIGRAALADPKTRRQLLPQAATLFDTLLKIVQLSRQDKVVRLRLSLTPQMLGGAPTGATPGVPAGAATGTAPAPRR